MISIFQSVHYDSKERGGDRISRYDGHVSRDSGYSGSIGGGCGKSLAPPIIGKRGVSPTPLGNLKYHHPDVTITAKGRKFVFILISVIKRCERKESVQRRKETLI